MRAQTRSIAAWLLCSGAAFAAAPQAEFGSTPAWLPRAAFAGAYFNNGAVTPQVRLQWEAFLAEQSRDALIALLEAGGGYGISLPATAGEDANVRMTYLYQHPVLAGFGLRGRRGAVRFGLHLSTGPVFFGARYEGQRTENRVLGLVEGRVRGGFHVGGVSIMASAGYASTYDMPRRSLAAPFLGGFVAGLEVDWWH